MRGPEHYHQAEQALGEARGAKDPQKAGLLATIGAGHALLSLAAAFAAVDADIEADRAAWREAIGPAADAAIAASREAPADFSPRYLGGRQEPPSGGCQECGYPLTVDGVLCGQHAGQAPAAAVSRDDTWVTADPCADCGHGMRAHEQPDSDDGRPGGCLDARCSCRGYGILLIVQDEPPVLEATDIADARLHPDPYAAAAEGIGLPNGQESCGSWISGRRCVLLPGHEDDCVPYMPAPASVPEAVS